MYKQLTKENNETFFKIGTFKSKKKGYSFVKPVYENSVWQTLKINNFKGETVGEYMLNMYLDVQVLK